MLGRLKNPSAHKYTTTSGAVHRLQTMYTVRGGKKKYVSQKLYEKCGAGSKLGRVQCFKRVGVHLFRSFPPPPTATSLSELNELYRNNPFLCVLPTPPPSSSLRPRSSSCRPLGRRLSVNVFSRFAMFRSTSNSICRSSVDSAGDSGREPNDDGVRSRPSSAGAQYSTSKSIVICKQTRTVRWLRNRSGRSREFRPSRCSVQNGKQTGRKKKIRFSPYTRGESCNEVRSEPREPDSFLFDGRVFGPLWMTSAVRYVDHNDFA